MRARRDGRGSVAIGRDHSTGKETAPVPERRDLTTWRWDHVDGLISGGERAELRATNRLPVTGAAPGAQD